MKIEKLREVRSAYQERAELAEKITELESMRLSPRAAAYGAERVKSSPKGDIQPDNLIRMEKLLADYNAALARCTSITSEFEEALKKLNSRQRRLMRLYYIDGYTWERVSVEMNLSWRWVHQIKREALKIILD